MAYIQTRIDVGSYDFWKTMFDEVTPGARQSAIGHQLLRGVENPNEVFIRVEYASVDEARAGREKPITSGVLDRFADTSGPTVVEEVESVTY